VSYRIRADKNISRGFRDFAMSFKANPNSRDFGAVKNENAIKQAVLNLVKTDIGEKPFQYDVGSRVTALLFEPYDVFTGEAIKDEIQSTLDRYEKRIRVTAVNVQDGFDVNSLEVRVQYTIVGERIVKEIDFILERT
tara:strand:- start:1542 stop:1952 length:411 start_codon:yes stop_codon:yes gene_type:complete